MLPRDMRPKYARKTLPPVFGASLETMCKYWHDMDREFRTPATSPLHHNQRCKLCRKDPLEHD